VFDLMRRLNAAALANPELASDQTGAYGFTDRLTVIVNDIVAALDSRPITYVELGPEPNKTHAILTRLLDAGVQVQRYVAVDINPVSGDRMRAALANLLDRDRMQVINVAFDEVAPEDLHVPGVPTLLTNLGFQEGNEHPGAIRALLAGLLRRGDLVLSEMQLADGGRRRGVRDVLQRLADATLFPAVRRARAARGALDVPAGDHGGRLRLGR